MNFLNQRAVAEILAVSPRTLEGSRSHGRGPQFVRLSPTKGVRYSPLAVASWLNQRGARA